MIGIERSNLLSITSFILLINIGLFLLPIQTKAQNAKHWYFGLGSSLLFQGTVPTVTAGAITTSLGCTSVSDNNGQLVLYSDGQTVYNASHTVMPNGNGLNGLADQGALVIQKPGSSTIYYLFTSNTQSNVAGLSYSIIDMSLASGAGSVTTKNATLMAGSGSGKLTAGKHCNGVDVWVVSSNSVGTQAFLLSSSGINTTPVVSSFASLARGTLKISPNSKRIATAALGGAPSAAIAQFDNVTGAIASPTNLFVYNLTPNSIDGPYGIEFSADGSKLYYYSWQGCSLLQYDLCSAITSGSCIGSFQGETLASEINMKKSLQLGPDKKIYMTLGGTYSATATGSNVLGVINAPNQLGNACNFSHNGLSLGTYTSGWGLPNFPGYYFEMKPGAVINHTANIQACTNVSFSTGNVCVGTGYTLTGLQWNFGDPGSSNNTSNLNNPMHQYSGAGTYTVRLVRSFSDCINSTDTIYKTISVTQPSLTIITSPSPCAVNQATASVLGGTGNYSYLWSPGNFTSATSSLQASGIYTVFVTDLQGGCAITTTAQIPVIQLQGALQTSSAICNGGTGGAVISGSNGSGQYSYLWSNTFTTPSVTLLAGNHSVIVTDNLYGCQKQITFAIQQPPPIYSGIIISPSTACSGQSVTVTINLMGGSPPYALTWNNSTTSNTFTQTVNPGVYSFSAQVTDIHNCLHTSTTGIFHVFAQPTLTVLGNTICSGALPNLMASGATNYTWQPGNYVGAAYQPTLGSQNFSLVGEQNGCLTQIQVPIITAPPIQLNLSSNSPVCEGDSIKLFASAGLNYQWLGPFGYGSVLQNPIISTASVVNSGAYTLNVTDAFGCQDSSSIQMLILNRPIIGLTGNLTICTGESATVTASGGQFYNWSSGGTQPTKVIHSSSGFSHSLSVTASNGCTSNTIVTLKINDCVGVNTVKAIELNAYPIPADKTISIHLASIPQNCTVKVVSSNGELIQINTFKKQDVLLLNTAEWNEGLYFLIIETESGQGTSKVIIAH